MLAMNNNEYMHPDPDENLQPRTLIYKSIGSLPTFPSNTKHQYQD